MVLHQTFTRDNGVKMHELPPLPEPDTHCWDDDTQKDCWSHSADQMLAYAAAAVAQERERCAKLCEESNTYEEYDPGGFFARLIRSQ